MPAYYNEINPFVAQWLRNLIAQDLIAPGEVDERSIQEVDSSDLEGFSQCHFFAGIGVWSHALRCAGVSDDDPVWTGSPPCQPFSAAGSRKGTDDDRHLWPELFRLVAQCRPSLLLGEQVASKDGLAWFDVVQTDLEGEGYATAAVDLCAAGVGAPHIRQRLFFVGVGDAGLAGGMADADIQGRQQQRQGAIHEEGEAGDHTGGCGESLASSSYWDHCEWVACDDPRGFRWRQVEPGSFPLADGAPGRVGHLRAYGNALVAPLATEFTRAALACRP